MFAAIIAAIVAAIIAPCKLTKRVAINSSLIALKASLVTRHDDNVRMIMMMATTTDDNTAYEKMRMNKNSCKFKKMYRVTP